MVRKTLTSKNVILVDEAWMMMSPSQNGYQYTSAFLETMSRRIRKRNGGLCVASQRVDDFNQTQQGQAVITNAHTTFLLNHQESEVPALRKAFNLDEGVIANIFVNIAILSYLYFKDETAKVLLALSAIYMFVFMTNEHLAANFASFSLLSFNSVSNQLPHFEFLNILRHYSVTFFANWVGGGVLMGLAYAWLE